MYIILYMSPYLVFLLSLDFFLARLATLPYGFDSNITKPLANLLTKSSLFYYLQIVSCNRVSIKIIFIVFIIIIQITTLFIFLSFQGYLHSPSGFKIAYEIIIHTAFIIIHAAFLSNHPLVTVSFLNKLCLKYEQINLISIYQIEL